MVDATIPQERCIFYVYVIFRPTGEPCYVGKGKGGRWKDHVRNAYNPHLRRIYDKANGDLPVVKVRDHLTNDESVLTEIALIAALGREVDKSGILVNISTGGDGVPGWVPSEETRLRISVGNSGKKHTDDTRKLMSAIRRGRLKSAEHRNAIGAAHVGMKRSEECKERMRAAAAKNREKKAESISKYHAAMTDEQKAQRGKNISAGRLLKKMSAGKNLNFNL